MKTLKWLTRVQQQKFDTDMKLAIYINTSTKLGSVRVYSRVKRATLMKYKVIHTNLHKIVHIIYPPIISYYYC